MIAHRRTDMVRGVLVQRQRRVSLTFRQALLPDVGAVNLKCSSIEQDHVYRCSLLLLLPRVLLLLPRITHT